MLIYYINEWAWSAKSAEIRKSFLAVFLIGIWFYFIVINEFYYALLDKVHLHYLFSYTFINEMFHIIFYVKYHKPFNGKINCRI